MSKENQAITRDVDVTHGEEIVINLKPGMAWALYHDKGPGGPCGQSMRVTFPHSVLMTWPSEDAMRESLQDIKWRNKKHEIMYGVVDDWTSGGVLRVIQYAAKKEGEQ